MNRRGPPQTESDKVRRRLVQVVDLPFAVREGSFATDGFRDMIRRTDVAGGEPPQHQRSFLGSARIVNATNAYQVGTEAIIGQ